KAPQPLRRLLEGSRGERDELEPLFAELARLRTGPALAHWFQLPSPLVRHIVHCLDHIGLAPSAIQRYLAISHTVAERADYFPPGVDVEVLHHPSDLPRAECTGYEHLFTASRLDQPKRVHLLIDAFRQVETDRHFRIAGTGPAEAELRARAAGDPRIQFLGHISDQQIIAEYGRALFVPFVPYDEDYGLITLEAMRAAKPVLTSTDAGGVNELVEHGRTGLSVAPEPAALAAAMRQLITDPAATQAMGEAARARVACIDWSQTLEVLLRTPSESRSSPHALDAASSPAPTAAVSSAPTPGLLATPRRPRVVVTVDFPVYPPRGGGQARVYHLYRALARHADCTLVSLCDDPSSAGQYRLAPGLIEQRVAKSRAHLKATYRLNASTGVSAGDLATLLHQQRTPAYAQTLAAAAAESDLVIASHPYLYPSIAALQPPRLWYEAHNVEWDMKRAVLGEHPKAAAYLQQVADTEQALCQQAERILVCTEADGERLAELYAVPQERCLTVPNGVDTAAVKFVGQDARQAARGRLGLQQRHTALFIGSWHQPNIEAAEALKPIAEQRPEIDFLVVGSVCQHPVLHQHPATLHALGLLGDAELGVLLGAVCLALNPVTTGSGTNLKMLHYAAAGVPILSTPFGNRGLAFVPGEHLWVAEQSMFAAQIEMILADAKVRDKRAQAAREITETQYDWRFIASRITSLSKGDADEGKVDCHRAISQSPRIELASASVSGRIT
ncbi:MAG: glycosyltransferase family 4 protein, partial [Chromatiaceae bacterium]|nr:glycosyltransferase family 4 protein [Chromatiaceae bacterium]